MEVKIFFILIFHIINVFSNECFDSRNNINDSLNCNSSFLDLQFDNKTKLEKGIGIIKVKFNLDLICDSAVYKVTLTVIENVNNCENAYNSNKWKFHSEQEYYRKNDTNLKPCKQTIELDIPYIYTGCYKVNVIGETTNSIILINQSKVNFIQSEYTKENISIISVGNYRDIDQSYPFDVKIKNKFIDNEIELSFKLYNTNDDILSKWTLLCPLLNSTKDCVFLFKQNVDIICSSRATNAPNINCTLQNIEQGSYKLLIALKHDPRCHIALRNDLCEIVFKNMHVYPQPIEKQSPQEPESKSKILLIIIIPFSFVVITFVIIIMMYLRRKIYPIDSEEYKPVNIQEETNENFDILLLYARDCEEVMEAMEALKLVLEEFFPSSVVRDIYLSPEVANAPADWILTQVSRPPARMKTILLASYCAHIRLQHPSIQYRSPSFYDDLFPLAFRAIAVDFGPLFVLNFSADEYRSFMMLSRGRRFVLPETLNEFLRILGAEDIDGRESQNVKTFRERCQEVGQFYRDHPDYITDILNVVT